MAKKSLKAQLDQNINSVSKALKEPSESKKSFIHGHHVTSADKLKFIRRFKLKVVENETEKKIIIEKIKYFHVYLSLVAHLAT